MRPRDVIPLTGLVAMAVVVGLALREASPLQADFGPPPAEADLPRPNIDVGIASLAGELVGADGRPVEGASLVVVRAGRPIWAFSDARGRFRLSELDEGPVDISVHAPGHPATLLSAQAGVGPVVLRLTEVLPDPERLPNPEPVDLEGRVEAGGVDLSGFEVALLPTAPATEPGSGVPRRTACDADGSFDFEALTPAEYELLLLPPWASGGSWPDLLTPASAPPLRVVHPRDGRVEVVLAGGSIAGTVLEEDGGAPLEGALVSAVPLPESADTTDLRRFPAVRTGADGSFRIGSLPPGRYRVTLTAGEEVREADVTVAPGAEVDPGLGRRFADKPGEGDF